MSIKDLDWCSFLVACLNRSKKLLKFKSNAKDIKSPQYTQHVAFLVLLYLHCTKISLESLDIVYSASSYWSPTKAKDKLKEAFSSGGYENVEVTKTYEEFVDDAKVKDSKT
ncbi:unnamed protein product [Lactuca virosa]|uniref:Uncharacterized protein n=1 Tax=Lactuca virosa TaxID=75947 RepID=A0AAU9NZW0_9ASTR|nr:unnamed protein product [Lactuca virosa]